MVWWGELVPLFTTFFGSEIYSCSLSEPERSSQPKQNRPTATNPSSSSPFSFLSHSRSHQHGRDSPKSEVEKATEKSSKAISCELHQMLTLFELEKNFMGPVGGIHTWPRGRERHFFRTAGGKSATREKKREKEREEEVKKRRQGKKGGWGGG